MKKILSLFMVLFLITACSSRSNKVEGINIYSRDSASGTREAFESIIELETLSDTSAETTGNGDMAKQIGQDPRAIGYVSLTTDFEANGLKPLAYEGVTASIDTVNQGQYQLSRPFSFVTRAEGDFKTESQEALVAAFIDYLTNSLEAKEIILQAGGIVDVSDGIPWEKLSENHPIVNQDNSHITLKTGGSTSVEKTLTEAMTSFIPLAGNFIYESQHTGSSDGYKRTLGEEKDGPNAVDIGFASRAFSNEEEVSLGLSSGVYSLDAVVVVVNKENTVIETATKETLQKIFSGEFNTWESFD